jgi:hypothetical protein
MMRDLTLCTQGNAFGERFWLDVTVDPTHAADVNSNVPAQSAVPDINSNVALAVTVTTPAPATTDVFSATTPPTSSPAPDAALEQLKVKYADKLKQVRACWRHRGV